MVSFRIKCLIMVLFPLLLACKEKEALLLGKVKHELKTNVHYNLSVTLGESGGEKYPNNYIVPVNISFHSDQADAFVIKSILIKAVNRVDVFKVYESRELFRFVSSTVCYSGKTIFGRIPVPVIKGWPIEIVVVGSFSTKKTNPKYNKLSAGNTPRYLWSKVKINKSMPVDMSLCEKYIYRKYKTKKSNISNSYLQKRKLYEETLKKKIIGEWKKFTKKKQVEMAELLKIRMLK